MNIQLVAYALYVLFVALVIVRVGGRIHRNGRVFILGLLEGTDN